MQKQNSKKTKPNQQKMLKNLVMAAFRLKVMQNTLDHPNNQQTVNTVYQSMF